MIISSRKSKRTLRVTLLLLLQRDDVFFQSRPLSLENSDIVKQIVSFVGPGQFRFIALISKTFHGAYTDKFPDDTTTHMDVSTLTLVKFCLDDYLLVLNTGNLS